MKPACPKCGHTKFVAEIIDALNLNVNFAAICCSSCSSIVGTFDVNTYDRIKKITKALNIQD